MQGYLVRIGFLVNPISGTGGSVGLRGTDGVFSEAVRKGGVPLSYRKAFIFLKHFALLGCGKPKKIEVLAPPGYMGYSIARSILAKCDNIILREISPFHLNFFPSTRKHTLWAVKDMIRQGLDLLVFVGGDGTARDILEALGETSIPVLGIPAGVKVYSAVYAYTPSDAAEILSEYVTESGNVSIDIREVVDWISLGDTRFKVYGYLPVLYSKGLVQPSKAPGCYSGLEGAIQYIIEIMERNRGRLFLTGPGKTVKSIHEYLGLPYTLLGVDAIYQGKTIGLDLDYKRILKLTELYKDFSVIVTPIGGQGILFGRGNHQFSKRILEKLDPRNLFIIASECKMQNIKKMRIDTGYPEIDAKFRGYRRVITGYMEERVVAVE
jgi:predicted polyphosphate/ATP-dependent NAD kinase